MYKIPAAVYRCEELIKQSKFITTVAHTPTEEDAKQFIARIREEFSDASHNCWGYIAGVPGNTSKMGMSDDGEPHGTAGKPILNILAHSGIIEVAAVVTRYFGGVKLGTGGLVRAYSGSVKTALENISTREKRELATVEIVSSYARGDMVKNMVNSFDTSIITTVYTSDISMQIEVATEEKEAFLQAVQDAASGELLIREC